MRELLVVLAMNRIAVLVPLALSSLAGCAADEGASSSTSLTQPVGECGPVETHVFGIFKTPGGEARIHIDRPGHHAVVVSAHEATTWRITTGPDAVIDGVYAVGIHEQTLVGMKDGIKLVTDSKDTTGVYACGYTWPYDGAECNTEQLLLLSGKIVNHEATSFHGCYEASSFRVAKDLSVTSNCELADQADFVAGCAGPDSCGGPIFL